MRWLRMGFLILVLVAGAYSCSGAKGQLEDEPVETLRRLLNSSSETAAASSPEKRGPSPAGIVEGSIEYKDTGIMLTVTPRISDGGPVSLEINAERSTVGTTSLGNLASIPFFNKKMAKTTLAILEGQTSVI